LGLLGLPPIEGGARRVVQHPTASLFFRHHTIRINCAGTPSKAKTDVGWIGNGYKYAFESVRFLSQAIENNSDHRRFIWTVEGWAGTHRYAVMWTGDDYGTFDYIRWQLATFAGSGFSAQAHVSGDVDGIFGGSPDTYVRDLQFKCMTTTIMVMSGWATNPDKQPWTYGEPYASINRMYASFLSSFMSFVAIYHFL
jgi:alpha-glucosidase